MSDQRWVVDAAHRDTGDPAQFVLEATTLEQAAALANQAGYVVAHVCPAPVDVAESIDFGPVLQRLHHIERQLAPISGWYLRAGPKIATGFWLALGWLLFSMIIGVVLMLFTCAGGLGLFMEALRGATGGQG